jgi:hypothetical protein
MASGDLKKIGLLLKTGSNTKANGTLTLLQKMVEEFKFGQMVVNMKDIGKIIKQMEKED